SGGGDPVQGWIHGSTEREYCRCACWSRATRCPEMLRSVAFGYGGTKASCHCRKGYMKLPRFIGIVDLGIATVVLVALILPPRGMEAEAAVPGSDADRFAIALAEARTIAHPDNAAAAADLSRRLGEAGFNDWAIETAMKGSERSKGSPARWRALLAASVAFID